MYIRVVPLSKLRVLVSHNLHMRRMSWILKHAQYARITLTRFTTIYFFLAVFTCVALSALQVLTFNINLNAASLLKPIDDVPNFGVPILDKGRLKLCQTLPSEGTKSCVQVIDFGTNYVNSSLVCPFEALVWHNLINVHQVLPTVTTVSEISSTCIVSLRWLHELWVWGIKYVLLVLTIIWLRLQDAEREDIVALIFNIYLFVMALVTVCGTLCFIDLSTLTLQKQGR
jgi:hypothetical protein